MRNMITVELSPERALEILCGMDSGEIKFIPIDSLQACHPRYFGYPDIEVTVFDDGGEWDYVDHIKEGNLIWDPDCALDEEHKPVFFWQPTNWRKWANSFWNDTIHPGPMDFPSNAAL